MGPLTRLCYLPPHLGRLSLLALPFLRDTCLPSLWNPLFPLHATALIPLSLTKVRLLLTLTLSHHTIWRFGQTALFLVSLLKAAQAYLPTALSVALFPFQQAQYAQVFPLKPAPFCKLFAAPTSLPLLLLS